MNFVSASIVQFTHHHTHVVVCWMLLNHVCQQNYCFAILRVCIFSVTTQSQRYPKDIISVWVIMWASRRGYCSDTHTSSLESSGIVMAASHCKCVKMLMLIMMFCSIWYHFYNIKNVKNTQGGVLLLVKAKHWAEMD